MKDTQIVTSTTLSQNPLFWPGQGNLVVRSSHQNIFLGGGIATPKGFSQAVPFDLIGFMLSAEFLKQNLSQSQIFMLIADQHAWLANGFDPDKSTMAAHKLSMVIGKIIRAFKFTNWHIFHSSKIFPSRTQGSYEDLELKDVLHFVNHHQVSIKLGWKFSQSINTIHQTDEAHFDSLIPEDMLKSIFIKPGVTLDSRKPHESPYICTDPNQRLIIDKHEDVTTKLSGRLKTNQTNANINHLRCVVQLFEQLIFNFPPKTPLNDKLQKILDTIQ